MDTSTTILEGGCALKSGYEVGERTHSVSFHDKYEVGNFISATQQFNSWLKSNVGAKLIMTTPQFDTDQEGNSYHAIFILYEGKPPKYAAKTAKEKTEAALLANKKKVDAAKQRAEETLAKKKKRKRKTVAL